MSDYIPKTRLEELVLYDPYRPGLNYSMLSWNPQITWEFKFRHPNLDWDWKNIYKYSAISLSIFEKFIYHNIHYDICYWLSDNIDLDLNIIEKYPDLNWDWNKILYNSKIGIDFIIKFFTFCWTGYLIILVLM